jgi:hypothetical protein
MVLYICCTAKLKKPTGINQNINFFAKIAKEEMEDPIEEKDSVNIAVSLLGRLGGLKGGKARAKSLTAKKRSEIAKKAATA